MFKYTRAAISLVFEGIKKTLYWATVLGNSIYLFYLIFALCTGVGFWFINVALLAVNVAYFIFFFIIEHKKKKAEENDDKNDDKQANQISARGNRLFSLCKVCIQFINLGIIIYGIAFLGNDMPPLNIIFVTLMIIFLLLQIVFIVLGQVIDSLKEFISAAFEADMDEGKKPVRATGNFFKKLFGKEVAPEPEPTKAKKKIDKFLQKREEAKEKKAAAKKAKRAAEKKAAKDAKAAKKASKKTAAPPVGDPQEAK